MGGNKIQTFKMAQVENLETALAAKLETSLLKTSLTDNSDSYIPSQKAVKTVTDTKVTGLTAVKVLNFTYGMTAAQIQALIDAVPKNMNGYGMTLSFADCPYKYFNGTTDNISGNGVTTTVTLAGHGFATNDEIALSGFISGTDDLGSVLDGEFIVTVTDANTFTFASTYNGTKTPLATTIARKVWNVGGAINISNFLAGDIIYIVNDWVITVRNTQKCFLKNCEIIFTGVKSPVVFYGGIAIKARATETRTVAIYLCPETISLYGTYMQAQNVASQCGVFADGFGYTTVEGCVVKNAYRAINGSNGNIQRHGDCYSLHNTVTYGVGLQYTRGYFYTPAFSGTSAASQLAKGDLI